MKLATNVKSISYLKAHAADILRELAEVQEPFLITQNGEVKAIIQDIVSYEQTQEALALMKILAMGKQQVKEGKVQPAAKVIKELRAGLKNRK